MLSQMTPYRPTLYRPDSRGRFRLYPRVTTTPIPGAGYEADDLVWAEQELDLKGGGPMQPYGSYSQVPLRGLGASDISASTVAAMSKMSAPSIMYIPQQEGGGSPPPTPDTSIDESEAPPPRSEEEYGFDVAQAIEDAARAASQAAAQPEPAEVPFYAQKVGGVVPVWAIGAGGLAVAGGLTWWLISRRK